MKRNIIAAYTPTARISRRLRRQTGFWYGFYLVPYAITYNTTLVAKAGAPKSFDDLLPR